jgi:AcrR family transcriptional regulator
MSSPGLRERKKQKTRWSIQEHALRLFQEQGYEQTTVDQIAAAAEISPSTFFRYFKTKEDVVIEDEYDPLLLRLLAGQPADRPVLAALRDVVTTVLGQLSKDESDRLYQRTKLQLSVPALRARMIDGFTGNLDMLTGAIAERTGRAPDDPNVRIFVGALVGAMLVAIISWAEAGATDNLGEVLDRALAYLEDGLPLQAQSKPSPSELPDRATPSGSGARSAARTERR